MLQTILYQLWNQRRQNAWIFLELLFVSFFLWTVIDPIYVLTANHSIDKGYDPKGVYVVNIGAYAATDGRYDPAQDKDSLNLAAYWRIVREVRSQPEVESCCISTSWSFPNSNSGTVRNFLLTRHRCTRARASCMRSSITSWRPRVKPVPHSRHEGCPYGWRYRSVGTEQGQGVHLRAAGATAVWHD